MVARRSKKSTPMAGRKKTTKKLVSETQKKTGSKGGRPAFRPTGDQRENVEAMVGFGLTYKEIAVLIHNPQTGIGISTNTLERHFRKELDCGRAKVKAKVIGSLVKKACSDSHPQAAVCSMFFLKCQHGWRQEDKLVHEVEGGTGVLVAPARVTPEVWIREQEAENLKRRRPGGDG